MESVTRSHCYCNRWKKTKFLTSIDNGVSAISKISRNINCEHTSTKNCDVKLIQRTLFQKFNKFFIISITLLLLFCLAPVAKAEGREHLCGGRLIDALRYICGTRGIYNPSKQSGSSRKHSGNKVSITRLCCEEGCSLTQLERFCAPLRSSTSTRSQRRRPKNRHVIRDGPPLPPHLASATPQHSRRIHLSPPNPSTPPSTTLSRITNSVARTKAARKQRALTQLEKRYEHLVQKERRSGSRKSNRNNRKKSFLQEIVKVAADIYEIREDHDDAEYTDHTDHSHFILATLHDSVSKTAQAP